MLYPEKKNKKRKNLKWLKGELDDDWSKYFKKADVLVHLAAIGLKKCQMDILIKF